MIKAPDTAVLVIDVQEGFRSYDTFEAVAEQAGRLVRGAEILGVPVLATEQYPRGLGATAEAVALPESTIPVEKTVFSAVRADGFDLGGRTQVVLCGIEAHVCVAQTALDLLAAGTEVQLAVDAIGSRNAVDREVALRRLENAGCTLTTVEAALLELCERAGTPEFKAVQGVIL